MEFVKEICHRYISVATSIERAVVLQNALLDRKYFCMGKERRKKKKLGIKNAESWHILIGRLSRII